MSINVEPPDDLVALTLVPVEVFGTDGCGDPDCKHCAENSGYGLSDAVQSWSDCNRAAGRIYRVDEPDGVKYRLPGETVTVYVNRNDLPYFEKVWGEPW